MSNSVRDLERVKLVAHVLDTSIPIPGTRFRFGLDAVLDLIPGLGAAIGGVLSMYILVVGSRLGAARATVLRMAFNILIDVVFGSVPVLGVIFDAGWKANVMNVALIEQGLVDRSARKRADSWFVGSILLGLGVVAGGVMWLAVLLISAIVHFFQTRMA